ncbi:MAG TPA: D-amino acid aminotransferase [Gammaproteobacteria bacterium]|nr:D-amino acid aminotransferase [Gammaproteobacteria bacterium]
MSVGEPSVYLNGEFRPLHAAAVSPLDRGFLFGDGVYEVIPVYSGLPFRLEGHLERLRNSLAAVRIPDPHRRDAWAELIAELIRHNGGGDLSVYLQVTRGAGPGRDHFFPTDARPTVFLMASPLRPPAPEVLEQGIAAVTRRDYRWERCDIKAITLLPNVLLRQEAREAGCSEAILVRGDGRVHEGAASNLFAVIREALVTPPKDRFLLPGITRDLVLELARADGLAVEERPVDQAELAAASEIWITSSTREVLPVTRLDDRPVGEGRPGPLWHRVDGLIQAHKRQWLADSGAHAAAEGRA